MSIYTFYADPGADFGRRADPIDGDRDKVWPVGFEFHPVTHSARLEDGTRVDKTSRYQGVPIDPTHMPKKIKVGGGKTHPVDVIMHNAFIVSEKFHQVVEQLEPGHQFVPTELVWKDGSHAASYFWFFPCNRIDCLDREHTTHEYREKTGHWMSRPGGRSVVNLEKVRGYHIWIDPRWNTFSQPIVTEAFKQAMSDAGVRGLAYNEVRSV